MSGCEFITSVWSNVGIELKSVILKWVVGALIDLMANKISYSWLVQISTLKEEVSV